VRDSAISNTTWIPRGGAPNYVRFMADVVKSTLTTRILCKTLFAAAAPVAAITLARLATPIAAGPCRAYRRADATLTT
jgi:hypothetical protein